jgi:hypothetical protein
MERSINRPKEAKPRGHPIALLLHRAAEMFARDAEGWGLTPGRALAIAVAPILAVLGISATVAYPGLFQRVIEEDRLVEWSQFALLLPAGFLFAQVSVRLIRSGRTRLGVLYLLLAIGVFFVAGEEISWGQRILGLHTPESLAAMNAQQEISVHNIYSLHAAFIYAVMLGGAYGTIAPLVGSVFAAGRPRASLGQLLVPPLCLVPAFLVPFGYRFWRLVFQPDVYRSPGYRTYVITKFSEVGELCFYFALLVFAWLTLRRLRQEPR